MIKDILDIDLVDIYEVLSSMEHESIDFDLSLTFQEIINGIKCNDIELLEFYFCLNDNYLKKLDGISRSIYAKKCLLLLIFMPIVFTKNLSADGENLRDKLKSFSYEKMSSIPSLINEILSIYTNQDNLLPKFLTNLFWNICGINDELQFEYFKKSEYSYEQVVSRFQRLFDITYDECNQEFSYEEQKLNLINVLILFGFFEEQTDCYKIYKHTDTFVEEFCSFYQNSLKYITSVLLSMLKFVINCKDLLEQSDILNKFINPSINFKDPLSLTIPAFLHIRAMQLIFSQKSINPKFFCKAVINQEFLLASGNYFTFLLKLKCFDFAENLYNYIGIETIYESIPVEHHDQLATIVALSYLDKKISLTKYCTDVAIILRNQTIDSLSKPNVELQTLITTYLSLAVNVNLLSDFVNQYLLNFEKITFLKLNNNDFFESIRTWLNDLISLQTIESKTIELQNVIQALPTNSIENNKFIKNLKMHGIWDKLLKQSKNDITTAITELKINKDPIKALLSLCILTEREIKEKIIYPFQNSDKFKCIKNDRSKIFDKGIQTIDKCLKTNVTLGNLRYLPGYLLDEHALSQSMVLSFFKEYLSPIFNEFLTFCEKISKTILAFSDKEQLTLINIRNIGAHGSVSSLSLFDENCFNKTCDFLMGGDDPLLAFTSNLGNISH